MKKVAKRRQIQIAAMESDTTEKESTAASLEPTTATAMATASASAELQSPQSESVVGVADAAAVVGVQGEGEGDGIAVSGKRDGEATPPPTKRQKIEQDEDASKQKKKELDNDAIDDDEEEEAPQLVEPVERVQSTQSSLRSFNRIPVFIVDYHNDVLEFIYRCLATRHLPLERNILVHFDSHPDMVVARDIPASASYDKDIMLNELSIENWIMPTLYAGKILSRFPPRAVYSSSFFPRSLQSRCLAKELMVPTDSYRQT